MFGRIGSGLTPPKYGLRSWWISVTRIRPPPSSRGEPARAGAVHRLDEDVDVGRLQRVEVDRPADVPLVALERVEALDEAGRLGIGKRPALDRGPPLPAIAASMTDRISGPAAAPVGDLTLKPLSVHGLWLAVMTIPAAAPRWTTSYELIWVGTAVDGERDRDVVGEEDLGGGGAKCSEAKRRSNAMTTPFACSPRSTT